ncbi:MAG TPA: FliA/WhiG family RNA polymerase sigma factor [Sedimentisphaerales bacterium]|nr:FliA/WhiG family RNA polymerase sigma factor [Sedimentisphaerales bacterium]
MTSPPPADKTLEVPHGNAAAVTLHEQAAARKKSALKAYAAEQRKLNEERLILEYLPLVHRLAQNIAGYTGNSSLSYADLVSAGTMGLVKAARDFDASRNIEFKTYAYIKVRGAIIDELRAWTFMPANVAKNIEAVNAVIHQHIEKTGSTPSDEEIAAHLDISVEKLHHLFERARSQHFLSIHRLADTAPALAESLADNSVEDPSHGIEKAEMIERLAAAIQSLPQSQRHVIVLYYQREMTMKEVAAALDVTESRVSQLHASALVRLSASLRKWEDGR